MPGRFEPLAARHMASSFVALDVPVGNYQSCEMLSSVVAPTISKEIGRGRWKLLFLQAFFELFEDLQTLVKDAILLLTTLLEGIFQCISSSLLVKRFEERPLNEAIAIVVVFLMMGTLYFAMFLYMRSFSAWHARRYTLILFHKCFLLALISYYQGIVTDPGAIPNSWQTSLRTEEDILVMAKERKRSGELRLCNKEMKYKPDRAHYCSCLQRNVLRMDHYCPWMSNCIGHFNYKFFLQFLFYTVVSSSIACFVMVSALYNEVFVPGTTVMMVGSAGFAGLLASVLTPFFAFHAWMVSKNMTTIEFCEKLEGGIYTSPYDLGLWANLRSVLGGNAILWFLPIPSTPGDGITWQRR
ncbi:unnamed protein product [Durusdinium trenchii]|uniref:Palmitoyltransferase n=1 Tax=Durusdinium trenchii TaxID=1381693 RepID=A0ABP0SGL2_9DINO